MLKWFTALLASISSLFVADRPNVAPPLNTAIIAYQETYYVPAVADPDNFPWAKKISSEVQTSVQTSIAKPTPLPVPAPLPTSPPPPPQDPYLAIPAPITSWLSMNLTLRGNSNDPDNPRTLPEITFDREYWRIEVFAYWAPDIIPPKPPIENDYFKLEVYEKGTDKLIYTMTSGSDESIHKFQALRKSGTYYFKVYAKDPSEWEISFVVSPKIAQ